MAPTAPPIDGQTWIGCAPPTPEQLLGRTVLLLFWAGSCEASLRQLQRIQNLARSTNTGRDRDDPAVVAIAVHSPRMPMDDDLDRLRRTLTRHRVDIPVVHDPKFETWNRYDPPGWPSTVVIDGNGTVAGILAGCRDGETLDQALHVAIHAPASRWLRRRRITPEPFVAGQPGVRDATVEREPPVLRGPEGLAVFAGGECDRPIAVADTGNDRVLLGRLDSTGRQAKIGIALDGLSQPTSVVFVDRTRLAVVERGTNIVSVIDPTYGSRTTVTDQLVRPTGMALDSDGSLIICDGGGDRLYRAVANSTESGYLVGPIAGSGVTGVTAGGSGEATLAQPSAVVRTSAGLVFSDAASSNLRLLTDDGTVVNITDGDLFDWGLVDGPVHRARLQRPSSLCNLDDGSVLVVDSGNDRLRRLYRRRLTTLGLGGLSSPMAVGHLDGQRVVVADTDNHRLVGVDAGSQAAWAVDIAFGSDRESTDLRAAQAGATDGHVSSGSTVAAT